MTAAKVLGSPARIRFQDCDPFNHLNNAKYLDYFINAREDQLIAAYGLNIYEMAQKEGLSWVVGSSQLAYLRPALLMEEVWIESQLIAYSARDLSVEMRMYDQDKRIVKSVLWISFVHVNMKSQRSHEHSDSLMQLFSDVLAPIEHEHFKDRMKFYRLANKQALVKA